MADEERGISSIIDRCCDQARGVDAPSALAGGVLGLLVSSHMGRSVLGKVIKYGAVAGLGALAWQARRERQREAEESLSPRAPSHESAASKRREPGHGPS